MQARYRGYSQEGEEVVVEPQEGAGEAVSVGAARAAIRTTIGPGTFNLPMGNGCVEGGRQVNMPTRTVANLIPSMTTPGRANSGPPCAECGGEGVLGRLAPEAS